MTNTATKKPRCATRPRSGPSLVRHPSLKPKKSELRVRKSAAALPRRNHQNRQSDAKRRRLRLLTEGGGVSGGCHSGLVGNGLTRLVIGQSLAFDALKLSSLAARSSSSTPSLERLL